MRARVDPQTVVADRGYDNNRVYDECHGRGIAPVIPLRKGRAQPDTPIKRSTTLWGDLYRHRSAVEREFGRLSTTTASRSSACAALSASGCTPTS